MNFLKRFLKRCNEPDCFETPHEALEALLAYKGKKPSDDFERINESLITIYEGSIVLKFETLDDYSNGFPVGRKILERYYVYYSKVR